MPRSQPRRGFALPDLLVLLGMGTVTLALLVPATQDVRERANRMKCGNNLRQLALAAHNYHIDFNKLPPGHLGPLGSKAEPARAWVAPNATNGSHLSVWASLLPYLELVNVYKKIPHDSSHALFYQPGSVADPMPLPKAADLVGWWTLPAALNAGNEQVKLFRCPSDSGKDESLVGVPGQVGMIVVAINHYHEGKANLSPDQHFHAFALPAGDAIDKLGATNYLGVSGACGRGNSTNAFTSPPAGVPAPAGWGFFEGIMLNRFQLTLGQLSAQDGTSNTLMFGEALGGIADGKEGRGAEGKRELRFTWMGCGAMGTGLGMREQFPDHRMFSSRHPKAVMFAWADGSVRAIKPGKTEFARDYPAEWLLFMQLSGRRDGLNGDVKAIVE